jgi:hypothetical protein
MYRYDDGSIRRDTFFASIMTTSHVKKYLDKHATSTLVQNYMVFVNFFCKKILERKTAMKKSPAVYVVSICCAKIVLLYL